MYEIAAEAVITGGIEAVWRVATDVNAWPDWDPHERAARLDGGFEAGGTGWSRPNGGPATEWTITHVDPPHGWGSECGLPGGRLTGWNAFEPLPGGRVRCTKRIRVTGPLVPLFRLWFARGIRRDMARTFAALEAEVARRPAPARAGA